MQLEISGLSQNESNEIIHMLANLTSRYSLVKRVYIEAEETNRELVTNLQPLSEFKATLDHLFRLLEKILTTENDNLTERMTLIGNEFRSAQGHMCRAFFDIADALSINIREQIQSDLEPYSTEAIKLAMPDYYSHLRPQVDIISQKIADFRFSKGTLSPNQDVELFKDYHASIDQLKRIRQAITANLSSLQEADDKLKTENAHRDRNHHLSEKENRRFSKRVAVLSALLGAAAGAILTVLFGVFS